MSKLASVILRLIERVDQATKPRDPETEYGDESTVAANKAVRENGTSIKVLVD